MLLKATLRFSRLHYGTLSRLIHTTPTVNGDKKHYDVIIAGGGLVGISMALSLGKMRNFIKSNKLIEIKLYIASSQLFNEKSLLLLEGASPFKKNSTLDQFSNRVSAINKQSIGLFEKIGIWDHIKSNRCKFVNKMQVWGIAGESITFNHPDEAQSVSCIIENDLMLEGMYEKLKNHTNVEILNKSSVKDVLLYTSSESNVNTVITKNGEEFTCDLVIGADGFNSTIRKIMNVERWSTSYNQMGIVATLKLKLSENDNNDTAYQRFIPGGPIALLPLSNSESSLVWTCDPKRARELVAMEGGQFVAELNEAFNKSFEIENSFARNIVKCTNSLLKVTQSKNLQTPPTVTDVIDKSRAMFPLGFSHSSSYVCNGAALIGDAAHRIHPLAGQGVNLGFSDVLLLTEALEQAIYNGSVLNDLDYLLKYEKEALMTNVPMMVGIHAIQRMYCSEFPLNVILRNVGLSLANIEVPFKKFFMQKAFA